MVGSVGVFCWSSFFCFSSSAINSMSPSISAESMSCPSHPVTPPDGCVSVQISSHGVVCVVSFTRSSTAWLCRGFFVVGYKHFTTEELIFWRKEDIERCLLYAFVTTGCGCGCGCSCSCSYGCGCGCPSTCGCNCACGCGCSCWTETLDAPAVFMK